MVLAEGPEGKSRNVKSLDEKLVKKEAPGAREGKNMKVVEGRHRGSPGRVLRIVKEEGRSDRALNCLRAARPSPCGAASSRTWDAANASGENRGARGGGRGGRSGNERSREDPAWLQGNTRVRIVSKSFEGGRLYLKKGVRGGCSDASRVRRRRSTIPGRCSAVCRSGSSRRRCPNGAGAWPWCWVPIRGSEGKLLDKKGEAASVQLSEDFAVQNFTLDSIAEYTGVEED